MRWMFLAFAIFPAHLPAHDANFARCLASIRASTQGRRLSADTWDRYARGLQPDPRIIAQQQTQAEFTRPIYCSRRQPIAGPTTEVRNAIETNNTNVLAIFRSNLMD